MSAVPVLGAVVVFAAMLRRTDPLPLPLRPSATVIHDTALAAVHVQPDCAVTVTTRSAAPGPVLWDAGSIRLPLQSNPCWSSANGCPAIVRLAVRGAPLFAS